jgi:hypothetical protein
MFYFNGPVTGSVVISELWYECLGSAAGLVVTASATTISQYTLSISRCIFAGDGALVVHDSFNTFRIIGFYKIFSNLIKGVSILRSYGDVEKGDSTYQIEDNILISSATAPKLISGAIRQARAEKIFFKRNYLTGASGTAFIPGVEFCPNVFSETFLGFSETNAGTPANRENIVYSTANFISLDPTNAGYLVPRADSILYTAASQDTNIPENVVGINGVTITRRAVSPCASPGQIPAAAGVTAVQSDAGVVITWEASTLRTLLYWAMNVGDIEDMAPLATVDAGVTTYLIPKESLTASASWWVDVRHGG